MTNESILAKPPKQRSCFRYIALVVSLFFFGIVALWSILYAPRRVKDGEPLVHVSPESTVITEPLDENGDPDYIEYLNQQHGEGITPENNSVVMMVQAIGPENKLFGTISNEFYERLGTSPVPSNGDYWVSVWEWKKSSPQANGQIPVEQQEEEFDARYYFACSNPWTAQQFPDFAVWLERNSQPLSLIRQASLRPRYYLPLIDGSDVSMVMDIDLRLVDMQRELVRTLSMSAMKNLGDGNIADAFDNALTIRRLARLINQGATAEERLLSRAFETNGNRIEWQIAQSGRATEQELLAYRAIIEKLPALDGMSECFDNALRFWMLDGIIKLGRVKVTLHELAQGSSFGDESDRKFLPSSVDWNAAFKIVNPVFDKMAAVLENDSYVESLTERQIVREELTMMEMGTFHRMKLFKLMSRGAKGRFMAQMILSFGPHSSYFYHMPVADSRAKAGHLMSLIVLCLEAYKTHHGEYPENLAQLVPEYIGVMPLDPFVDAPFHYNRKDGRYLLYSVGKNQLDDLGVEHSDNDQRDDFTAFVEPTDLNETLNEIRDRWDSVQKKSDDQSF